jgi:hypothetical protein
MTRGLRLYLLQLLLWTATTRAGALTPDDEDSAATV